MIVFSFIFYSLYFCPNSSILVDPNFREAIISHPDENISFYFTPFSLAIALGNTSALEIFSSFSFVNTTLPLILDHPDLLINGKTAYLPPLGVAIFFDQITSLKYLSLTLPYSDVKSQYLQSKDYLDAIARNFTLIPGTNKPPIYLQKLLSLLSAFVDNPSPNCFDRST